MDKLTISIITPSYNQGSFIEKTIQSVLNQDVNNIEHVIVDGGSTDETIQILHKYQPHLRWISEKDKGQADAVNKGLRMTSGDIIGWLNSDDIYYPNTIQLVRDFFEANPDVDVVYGKANEIDSQGQLLQHYPTHFWDLEQLKVHCFISQPATFFRRRVVMQHGLLDAGLHFCLDYEYWLRLGLKQAKFAYLPQILAGSRIHSETKSTRFYLEAHFEAINMLQKKLGYIPSDWIVNYSSAKTKMQEHLNFPNPFFIAAVWLNLWKTAGLYNKGFARISIWIKAQLTMLRKFLVKGLNITHYIHTRESRSA